MGEALAEEAMVRNWRRYAVYIVPEAGSDLARWGAAWLGWDPEAGAPRGHPVIAGLPRLAAELTAEPRRYGFHGTLVAPFRMAGGRSEAELTAVLGDLAGAVEAFEVPLRLEALGTFLALVPARPVPALSALAAAAVIGLERFRAPLMRAERERRIAAGLTPRQQGLMQSWGYPWVLDAYEYHMTLTGQLPAADFAAVRAALERALEPMLATPLRVADLALFVEGEAGYFHLVRRFPLRQPDAERP
jgi:putative phosphonate metabolism protein